MGRGNLNRGERRVSQLFQVKVEFGASVFVCNWVVFGADSDILQSLRGRAEVSHRSCICMGLAPKNYTLPTAAVELSASLLFKCITTRFGYKGDFS